ncbi:MAG: DUF3592 domain-containing protein [Lewinellaceae bacterium]|nr:DUF3592 domain-containing protein [Lewinellaceae bacterium]
MKSQGCLYPFFAIFALAGLGCGVWGITNLISHNRIKNEGVKTTGTVISLRESHSGKGSTTYAPVIEFRDTDGNLTVYNSSTYTNVDPYKVGSRVELWYLPSNPEWDVVIEGDNWWIYFPFIFLLTHGGVGITGLVWLERKRRLHKWLHEQGQEVNARFLRVDVSRGKSTTYTLVCEWKDPFTSIIYEFKSDSISKNPEEFVSSSSESLRVLIDPANPKRYWVDMGFMGD